MKLDIPSFKTKKELFAFLVENKTTLENQKKSAIKYADGVHTSFESAVEYVMNGEVVKADGGLTSGNPNEVKVKAVINTTNLLDSHGDVHIKGLWKKSLNENKRILHVQEHKSNSFEHIISSGEDLKASVKDYSWKELGYESEGKTQALVFDSVVKQSRNSYMFDQYKDGFVDNHSVGMRYVKIVMAINDEDYGAEKEAWDKYIIEVANKNDAENQGYFWAVTEAKVIEGSAVPMGSNPITPTISTKNDPEMVKIEKTELELRNEAIIKWLKK
jgi:hypothetical protein